MTLPSGIFFISVQASILDKFVKLISFMASSSSPTNKSPLLSAAPPIETQTNLKISQKINVHKYLEIFFWLIMARLLVGNLFHLQYWSQDHHYLSSTKSHLWLFSHTLLQQDLKCYKTLLDLLVIQSHKCKFTFRTFRVRKQWRFSTGIWWHINVTFFFNYNFVLGNWLLES